jgi:arylsulfatase
MKASKDAGRPFYMYFNSSLMHMPVLPRKEFEGKTGYGNMADGILQMDADFGEMLDYLKELGVEDETIVVFSGDNGAEEESNNRGHSGFFQGSYFTGSEGSLRTPALVRYPGKVPGGRFSDDPVHITDMFTTLVRWAGCEVPKERIIDGVDQRKFFEGEQDASARDGFLFWNGPLLYGVKWRHYKLKFYHQTYIYDPALKLPTPHLINLKEDPLERIPFHLQSTWVVEHAGKLLSDFKKSLQREQLIPTGAPIEFVPKSAEEIRLAGLKENVEMILADQLVKDPIDPGLSPL